MLSESAAGAAEVLAAEGGARPADETPDDVRGEVGRGEDGQPQLERAVTGASGSMAAAAAVTPESSPLAAREGTSIWYDAQGRVRVDVGCLPDLSPETMHRTFADRVGPLIGFDNPHVYRLGEDRWLWLLHDSYLDYRWSAETLISDGPQIQNLAILQEGQCFTLIHRGRPTDRVNFEPGDELGADVFEEGRFFWPLGGEVDGDVLRIFWNEMHRSHPKPEPQDGIIRHPEGTWLAEYDLETLERLSFEPAPNPGVFPTYGFAVASAGRWSYLFGNSNLLNYEREGGYWNGPHTATQMYLARVPRGMLHEDPEYRTAHGWSDDPSDAVIINQRFFAENLMQPVYLHDRWVSVVKQDGFSGQDVLIDVAEKPWGPWRTVDRFPYRPRPSTEPIASYQPIILPWSNPDDGLSIMISENAHHWPSAVEHPAIYGPSVIRRAWPD